MHYFVFLQFVFADKNKLMPNIITCYVICFTEQSYISKLDFGVNPLYTLYLFCD